MKKGKPPSGYVWRDGYHLCARLADPVRDVDAEGNLPDEGQLVIVRRSDCTDATQLVASSQLENSPMHGKQLFVRKNMVYGIWKKRKVTNNYVKYTSPVYWVRHVRGIVGVEGPKYVVRVATRTKVVRF